MAKVPVLASRLTLPLSIALNAFLLAVIVAHWWHRPPHPPDPRRLVEEIAHTLPPADAEILIETFRSEVKLPPGDHHERRHQFEDRLRERLRTEPFDPEALQAVLDQDRREEDGFRQAMAHALVKAASRMSPGGRHRLADWRARPPP